MPQFPQLANENGSATLLAGYLWGSSEHLVTTQCISVLLVPAVVAWSSGGWVLPVNTILEPGEKGRGTFSLGLEDRSWDHTSATNGVLGKL